MQFLTIIRLVVLTVATILLAGYSNNDPGGSNTETDGTNVEVSSDPVFYATFISAAQTIIGTIISVFCTAMLAYTISRPEYALKKFVTITFIFTMYFSGGLIPSYLLTKELGLLLRRAM